MKVNGDDSKRQKTEDRAVTLFREYLRIESVHPNPDYDDAIAFLSKYSEDIGLDYRCVEVHPNRKVVVLGWKGSDESLPSILLNSHTDVVPVFPESWKHAPFDAVKEDNGDIYGRGTQDMKCVGIQYLEAIRKLKNDGKRLKRNIFLSFMPDEEIGGRLGMAKFLEHSLFKELNVGFALDEGLANPDEEFKVYYGQRSAWWVKIICTGNPGHGSRFIENTAVEKLQKIINQIQKYRQSQKSELEEDCCMRLGDVTTCNINMINGGVQCNVVPEQFTVGVDIRIAHREDLKDFEEQIKKWVATAGEGVSYEFMSRHDAQELTAVDESSRWWAAFSDACSSLDIKIETEVFPAGTDSKYLREIGIPAIGFSPMNNTPVLLHDHNEFLNEDVFLKGIDIYCEIISSLASVPAK